MNNIESRVSAIENELQIIKSANLQYIQIPIQIYYAVLQHIPDDKIQAIKTLRNSGFDNYRDLSECKRIIYRIIENPDMVFTNDNMALILLEEF